MSIKSILLVTCLISLCCLTQTGVCQINIDSVLSSFHSQEDDTLKMRTAKVLFDSYINNDLQEAKKYANEELRIAEKINYTKGIGMANLHLGVIYNYLSDSDSAKVFYQSSREIFSSIDDYLNVSVALRNLSIIEYEKGNYQESLALLDEGIALLNDKVQDDRYLTPYYHNKALTHNFMGNYRLATVEVLRELKILDSLDRPIPRADALNLLAIIEGNLKNFEKAIAYNEEAVVIYDQYNDLHFATQALSDIGLYYYHLDQYDSSNYHLNLALPVARDIKSLELETTILSNMARTQLALDNMKEAEILLKEGLVIAENIDSKNRIAETLNGLGDTYNRMNLSRKAVTILSRSIDVSKESDAKPTLSMAYNERSKAYALLGNYRLAYQDQITHKLLNDSIFDQDKTQQIEELKTLYETEQKEQQIAKQEVEIALFEQKENSAYLQRLALGGGLGLSLLALGIGFYAFRQRMAANRLANEKIEAELEFKKKELVTHALHLAKKNEVLEQIKQKALDQKKVSQDGASYQKLVNIINLDINDDDSWETFTRQFQEVHSDFYTTVSTQYPNVTPGELRLMSLIKMNLSSKEMANILNISIPGIKKARQRLRKKLELDTKDSLEQAVLSIA